MEKPTSLDSVPITSLNTRMACSGVDTAEAGYRKWCEEAGVPVDQWAVNYIRGYKRYYNRKAYEGSGYTDVKAAKRSLEEA